MTDSGWALANYTTPRFYQGSTHPFEDVQWSYAECGYQQKINLECPDNWDKRACDIVADKYIRKADIPDWKGTDYVPPVDQGYENSIKQLIHRVSLYMSINAYENGVISKTAAQSYYLDLCYLLLNRYIGFNTPVWINAGLYLVYGIEGSSRERYWYNPQTKQVETLNKEQIRPGLAACFLTKVEDQLHGESSMYDYIGAESRIFTMGAGNGANISAIRGRGEPIAGGGIAEGIIPFLKIPDRSAAYIKSGGVSRRAARMLVCDIDHPDIFDFITWKGKEEKKVYYMADSMIREYEQELLNKSLPQPEIDQLLQQKWQELIDWRGDLYDTVSGQTANNSIRCPDRFFEAVEKDEDWELTWRTDPKHKIIVKAKDLWNTICLQTWTTGDPGILFDDTIQKWNTVPHYGEVKTTNPCLSLDNTIYTDSGVKSLRAMLGCGKFSVISRSNDYKCFRHLKTETTEAGLFLTQENAEVWKVEFSDGITQKFTPNHKIMMIDGSYKELRDISIGEPLYNVFSGPPYLFWQSADRDRAPKPYSIKSVEPAGFEDVYDITVQEFHNFTMEGGVVVHNCGEITQPDYTTCNLCSLDLLKFVDQPIEDYIDAVGLVILSLETIAHSASTPTPMHAQTTHDLRPLGANLGNIGAVLMRAGLPYDSEEGRSLIAGWVHLLTAASYKMSAEIAEIMGSYPAYDQKNHYRVIQMHLDSTKDLKNNPAKTAISIYKDLIKNKSQLRNDAVTAMVPMGTIGLVMGCDTMGIEPDFSLVKYKTLSGGGGLTIINESVGPALKNLGYSEDQIPSMIDRILDEQTVVGIVNKEHEAVFDCAQPCTEGRYISYTGHIDMVAAIVPCISLSQSKTINVQKSAPVDLMGEAILYGWKKGLKGITLYRDGSKYSQPLNIVHSRNKNNSQYTEEDVDQAIAALSEALK